VSGNQIVPIGSNGCFGVVVMAWARTESPGSATSTSTGRIRGSAEKHLSPNYKPTQTAKAPANYREATTMTKILLTSIAACGLTSAALALAATATAAPSGPSPVDATISQLRAQGFQVIVNRVGTAPADRCTLSAVRPGQTFSRTDSGVPGAQDDLVTTVTNKIVYVDVTC